MALLNWGGDPWDDWRDLERGLLEGVESRPYPPINVYESADAYGLEAEVPGLDPKDLELTVEGDVVTISGEKQAGPETAGAYHRQERRLGRFARSLRLPSALDPAHVEAHCQDGVLVAKLAKAPEARARRIAVKAD